MKCFKCKSKIGVVNVPSLEKKACNNCFVRIIEKRFNKTVKALNLTDVRLRLSRPSDHVLLYLLNKRGLKVKVGKKSNINQSTLDDIAVSILKSFFTGKDLTIKGKALLEGISESELINYARINGLKFKGNPRQGENKRLHELLMKVNKRRPGVMYSLRDFIKKLFE